MNISLKRGRRVRKCLLTSFFLPLSVQTHKIMFVCEVVKIENFNFSFQLCLVSGCWALVSPSQLSAVDWVYVCLYIYLTYLYIEVCMEKDQKENMDRKRRGEAKESKASIKMQLLLWEIKKIVYFTEYSRIYSVRELLSQFFLQLSSDLIKKRLESNEFYS